jgi:hypothetical protein
MSVKENLDIGEMFGFIEVIEDFGRHDRTSTVANHDLVFMASIMFIKDQMHACIRQ